MKDEINVNKLNDRRVLDSMIMYFIIAKPAADCSAFE